MRARLASRASLGAVLAALVEVGAAESPTPTPTPAPARSPRLAGGTAPARTIGTGGSSLADIARRQKEQREREGKKPSVGVITNESLRKGGATPTPAAAVAPARGAKGRATPTPAALPTPVPLPEWRDLKGRSEADWHRMVEEARSGLAAAEGRVKTLEAETRRLENDFYAWSDGNYRERVIRPAWDQAREDLAKARQELDGARGRMGDLEEEARRSNAPPGWLR